jgi:hypothetical protein
MAPRPLLASLLRTSIFLAAAALAVVSAAACEEGTGEKKGPATPAVDPAEQARIDEGKKLIKQANDAYTDKAYDRVRKLLRQAAELNNESQRFEIEEAQERLDKKQAKMWANEVDETFKNKDCAGAFKQLHEPLKTLADSEAFTRELRKLVGADALKCAQDMVDQKTTAGAFADARKVTKDPQIVVVLGDKVAEKLRAELEVTIAEALKGQIAADLRARKWAAAVEKIDAASKKGDANDDQVTMLLESVRQGATPEIAALATKELGQNDAAAALRQIDQIAKTVRWAIAEPGGVQTGAVLPEDLAKKREALAIWVEAQHLAFKPLTKPDERWTHGKVQVFPAAKADAPSKQDIPHGTRIWILGTAKDKALVTTVDPAGGKLLQLLDKVAGWAPAARLVKENTTDWLVPDEELKGQRVWGPLRPSEPMWELGVVVDVSGKDITVQRLADGQNQKLTRQKLRSGRLSPGTRVLTFCVEKNQPAQVVGVTPAGRSANLKCDSGQEKEEDLASLRSKPEILPTTK